MAKRSYTEILQSLLVAQGLNGVSNLELVLQLDVNQFNKEVKIIKEAYRKTIRDYINGDKKLFDKAVEAWHNLGVIIDIELTINDMVNKEINA